MSKQSIPTITMSASDRRRLEKLARAAAAQGDRDALCLMGEINRAATVPDRAAQLDFHRHDGIVGDVLDQLGIPAGDEAIGLP